ncbi:hypothetical protein [Microbacterium thalassium]|uniref:Integral membrane protein n=1 Tax=Microbacterium thalassium TaxID=362649 RepID=A0A7X0KWA1_9MICO|nr:hypothetical protein [Microbacterium thalassium]MBB6392914.1 hypothetical protein [Microbacterium thalassium]GLK22855.1 hypothetical protein GCM10017607_01730 [Microbacterium thalassium]
MRAIAVVLWFAAAVGSFGLVWMGVYRVAAADGPGACVASDGPWLLAGVLAGVLLAGGAAALGSGWVAVGVAIPGLGTVALELAFACSFVPQLALPVLCLVGAGAAAVAGYAILRERGSAR